MIGNNGIITKAGDASNKTKIANVKDKISLIIGEWGIEKYTGTGTLKDFLDKKVTDGEIDAVTETEGGYDIEKDGYTISIDKDGNFIGEPSKTGPRPQISNIKVVANSDGTGENLPEKGTDEGTTLYITFDHSIEGGTTTVSPTLPFAVTQNGTYTFTVTGTVNGETSTKTVNVTVNQFNSEPKIGDYVNYTYDTTDKDGNALTYTLPSTKSGFSDQTIEQSSETLQWRILDIYEDESGNEMIDLASATSTSNIVYFHGALGYNNGVYLLNDICATLYSNSSKGITARSINLEDTEKHLTTAGLNARNNYTYTNGDSKYGETKTYTNNYSYYPKLYAYEIGSGVNVAKANASSISQPDKTIANPDPYKEGKASPSTSFTVPTTETYTQATDSDGNHNLTVTQTYYVRFGFNDSNKYYDEAGAVLTSSHSFWVASRFATCSSSCPGFGLRCAHTSMHYSNLFDSDRSAYTGNNCLRPVVSLSSSLLSGTKDSNGHWNLKEN